MQLQRLAVRYDPYRGSLGFKGLINDSVNTDFEKIFSYARVESVTLERAVVAVHRTCLDIYKNVQCSTLAWWLFCVTFVVMENQQVILCIVDLHVSINNIKISTIAQNAFMANQSLRKQ